MNFSSTIFLVIFLPVTIMGYYLIRSELKNAFLLVASLSFYAWGEPKLVLLLLSSILVNYLLVLQIGVRKGSKIGMMCMGLSLLWNFGLLYYYKYLAFTLTNVNALWGTEFSIPNIALPLGISFFTFRAVSYCLDVYWGTSPAQKSLLNAALYISFFPQVSMGPITKYSEFDVQFNNRKISFDSLATGIKRIIIGLAKKLILADQLGIMVDYIFNTPDAERTVLAAWLGILGYLLQLYFDFSGYSDMAIGIGSLFGFHTPENFEYPYLSKSPAEFWSRWHITLGTWLKVYLYTPVFRAASGKTIFGKRISVQYADYIALAAVWLFAGFWHGAEWHYVLYGLYFCFFIVLERIWDNYQKQKRRRLKLKKQPQTKGQAALAHLYFLIVIIFGQLLFRVPKTSAFLPYIKTLFGLAGTAAADVMSLFLLKENAVLFIIAAIGATPLLKTLTTRAKEKQETLVTCFCNVGITALLLICGAYIATGSYNPFLYFNF